MKQIITLSIFLLWTGLCICLGQTRQLSGTVTDKSDSSPLPGVTVMIKGTTTGTATDINGKFTLEVKDGDIVVISFVGMQPQEVTVKGQTHLDIALVPESQLLEETIVIAYGTRKKGSFTGSVSTVNSDKLADAPVASFAQALQGQAAGLQVFTNSGQPDSPSSFTLRGVNSLNAGTTPLFIIDGMQVSAQDFASYNINDFENVSVLKDASSTSIYGARATNGVVILTTKRGRMGEKARITVRGQMGISNLAYGKWDMMNTREKLDYEEEIGLRPAGYDRTEWEGTDVDWRDVIFRNNAFMQNYELAVNGGTAKSHYYLSAGYHDQEGITYATFFKRFTARINFDTQANDWFKAGMNLGSSYEKSNSSDENTYAAFSPLGGVRKMNPYWNPYNPDGSVASMGDGTWKSTTVENPIEYINSTKETSNKAKITGSLFLELTPIENLKLKSLGGLDFADIRGGFKTDPDYAPNKGEGKVTENFARRYTLLITNTADYAFTVNDDHHIHLLAGQEASYYNGESFGATGIGITDKRLLQFGLAPTFKDGGSQKIETTFLSYFGRAEYNYQEKYFLDATFRRDGSSRFGDNNKWGNFWSTGIMWNMQRENFMSKVPAITESQLSFTIGKQGNSSIPDYMHIATVGNLNYGSNIGIAPDEIGNPNLTWETTMTLNAGLKVGFWNRLRLSVDFYHKVTTDMLMQIPYSLTSGFETGWANIGEMRNNGVDVDLRLDVLQNKQVNWNIWCNFSYNNNKILKLFEDNDEYTDTAHGLKLKVGHAAGEFFANRFAGVNPANGDALYYTKDGDITTTIKAEDMMITTGKSYHAPWSGGFGTSVSYKGLSVSTSFSWVANRYMINNDRFFSESNGQFASENQSRKLLYERWKKPGDITRVPRHGVYMQLTDDRLIEDASFLRMKNVSVSWALPERWVKRAGIMESVKVFGNVENVFTITKFSGFDPEFQANVYASTYPLSRQITFGIEINL